MSNYVDPLADPDLVGGTAYELASVLIHSGTAFSGHYFAYVRDSSTGKWRNFNDESVTPLGGSGGSAADNSGGGGTGGQTERGSVKNHRVQDTSFSAAESGGGASSRVEGGGHGGDAGGGDDDGDGGEDLSFFVKAFGGRSDGASSASAYVLLYHRVETGPDGDSDGDNASSGTEGRNSKEDASKSAEMPQQHVNMSIGGGGVVPNALAAAIEAENDKWRADREAYLKRKNSVHFEVHHPALSVIAHVSVDKTATLADATRAAAAAVLADTSGLSDGAELRLRPCHLKTGKPTAPPLCVLETLGKAPLCSVLDIE